MGRWNLMYTGHIRCCSCSDQTPAKSHLRREGLILDNCEGIVLCCRKAWQQSARRLTTLSPVSANRSHKPRLNPFLLLIQQCRLRPGEVFSTQLSLPANALADTRRGMCPPRFQIQSNWRHGFTITGQLERWLGLGTLVNDAKSIL